MIQPDKDCSPKVYIVRRDGQKDLKFNGWLLGSVDNSGEKAKRWRHLQVHKSEGGSLVASEDRHTNYDGEVNRYRAIVIHTHLPNKDTPSKTITDFFGRDGLAKELYDLINIQDYIVIK